MEDKLNRMRSLVNQLNQASDVYYNGKGEILTDYEWDALFDQLKKLEEETGVGAHLVEIIAETPDWHYYDLPDEVVGTIWKGRYRGQRQKWYALRFHGADSDVNLLAHAAAGHAEFKAWQWAGLGQLADLIVPFKRELYTRVVAELGPHIR